MSKKMKGVCLDPSPYGGYEDAKARSKHQTLLQDYQELSMEAEAMKNKLDTMKQRKLTLSAEVRFLRRRHKYLSENKVAAKLSQGRELVPPQNFEARQRNTAKKKKYSRKEANSRNSATVFDVKRKERIFGAKESSTRWNPSPVVDLNQKNRIHSGKMATLRNTTPVFDLNQKERLFSGKETGSRNLTPAFDLNQMERTCIGRDDAGGAYRAPIFDLNQISGEEEELQDNYEPLKIEEPKKFVIRGGADETQNDLKLSVCRNVGNGPNRTGKRKISWEDPVALKV